MKKILLILIISLSPTASLAAQYGIFGSGWSTCASVIKNTDEKDAIYEYMYTSWIMGYFTGQNKQLSVATGKTQEIGRDHMDALYAASIKYCRDNLLDRFEDAVSNVFNQLK
tara:strand:- start:210 stop:545 length:336 start_codon:yes stop_codon:yes gene_type:complete